MAEAGVAAIYREHIRTLPQAQRQELLAMIAAELPAAQELAPTSPRHSILELHGLGKEIWQGLDAQAYVSQMRDEWDERAP